LKHWGTDWRLIVGVAALVAVAATAILYRFFRKPDDPEGEERRRRSQLNQVGRIVEGRVVELVETVAAPLQESGSGLFPGAKAQRRVRTQTPPAVWCDTAIPSPASRTKLRRTLPASKSAFAWSVSPPVNLQASSMIRRTPATQSLWPTTGPASTKTAVRYRVHPVASL
jgi:hypothetical protein